MSRVTIVKKRVLFVQAGLAVLLAAAVISQARVQLFGRSNILARAESSDRFIVKRLQIPQRGEIYSSDGMRLAMDERSRVLTINFKDVPKSRGFYMAMATATGISAAEFAQFAQTEKTFEWDRPFSAAQLDQIAKVKTSFRANGVGLKQSGARRYPMAEATAGLVGFMANGKPAGGFELMQDRILRGEPGKMVGMVDRDGQYLPTRVSDAEAKEDGKNIVLTLNAEIQQRAYTAVKDAVIGNRADSGVVVVMNPKTGDVYAMASYPSFDPNRPLPAPKKGQRSADFTPAYQAALEPGSTFKILTLAKALDDGVVGPTEPINCPGQITVGTKLVRCDDHAGHRAHGTIGPEEAIARSCNISAASWALRDGYDRFVPFVQDLGLLRKPNLGLPQEAGGLFKYSDTAKRLQLANLGFGQSINVTPVSLAAAFCMLANEGKTVTPRLIKKVGSEETQIGGGKQLIRPETAHTVLHFMRSVIDSDHGTGRELRIPGYELGGKTGTAQKANLRTRSMEKGGYVANFVGFAPAEAPEAVILVMVDNPKAGKIYGASVAGPVFVEVAKATIQALQIPPSTGGARMASNQKPSVKAVAAKSESRGPRVAVTTALAPELDPAAITRGLAAVRIRTVQSDSPSKKVVQRKSAPKNADPKMDADKPEVTKPREAVLVAQNELSARARLRSATIDKPAPTERSAKVEKPARTRTTKPAKPETREVRPAAKPSPKVTPGETRTRATTSRPATERPSTELERRARLNRPRTVEKSAPADSKSTVRKAEKSVAKTTPKSASVVTKRTRPVTRKSSFAAAPKRRSDSKPSVRTSERIGMLGVDLTEKRRATARVGKRADR